jgi:hypothetical protein
MTKPLIVDKNPPIASYFALIDDTEPPIVDKNLPIEQLKPKPLKEHFF